jgi:hypothetical protein
MQTFYSGKQAPNFTPDYKTKNYCTCSYLRVQQIQV